MVLGQKIGQNMKIAIILAVFTGAGAASYTAFDAYGIRQTLDPFTFIAWLFVFDGIVSIRIHLNENTLLLFSLVEKFSVK